MVADLSTKATKFPHYTVITLSLSILLSVFAPSLSLPSSFSLSYFLSDTQGYFVAHINELQALVIVQHISGQFNLYLSDITGVYFALSLADIVITQQGIDLELVSVTYTITFGCS